MLLAESQFQLHPKRQQQSQVHVVVIRSSALFSRRFHVV
jgi:hypothetical protein